MTELRTVNLGGRLERITRRFNLSESPDSDDDADIGWLIGEVRRLQEQNRELFSLLEEVDAFTNNIQLDISQLRRRAGNG